MAGRKTIEERFWSKVQRDGPIPTHLPQLGPCWLWTAGRFKSGYGLLKVGRTIQRAHRVSWTVNRSSIPPGAHVLHRCDNPPCVNPAHLFLGSAKVNMQDMEAKKRGVHYTGDDHWARRTPERVARGSRHGSRTKPERLPSGDQHFSKTRPELVVRGEQVGGTRLTEADVRDIRRRRDAGEECPSIARDFPVVDKMTVWRAATRRSWRHLT